ncbi:hypothetical protein NC86S3_740005 [Escherichia coli]|nr:hypothetical protein NCTC86R_1660002 [Escherichia coli]SOQ92533.1 hypothetical protein NC86S1_470004 [Escherichia coli]SOQ95577.1 hypothetical protein NC86S2_1260004 [Escherichia coli]SOR03655.1 hypothetical protein NC86S3_740005 [Escherichia coli]SOR07140.1 hypothetical protein CIP61R_3500001 [Escherichia coli]
MLVSLYKNQISDRNFALFSQYSKARQSRYSLSLKQITVLTNEVLKVFLGRIINLQGASNALMFMILCN